MVKASGRHLSRNRSIWDTSKWSPGAIFVKIMLVRIQQKLLKTSNVIFSDSSMADPLPGFVPCSARVGSVKTADAIVCLCT
ncbi:hypothetical protein TNCV_1785881 [Trichonephila clavipes]|nr:hypothetical protein TNCV_1785881 [Trichonephila clavipes]